ncbi:MAG: DEAD/DEAH box helicase [Planctomycetes bacterium]|nr:DEAD/DEAH box helicase [Planctomycetota bacterium]
MATQEKRRVRTLRDRLSHLNLQQVHKLLGPSATQLMRRSQKLLQHVAIDRDVYFRGDLFRLTLPRAVASGQSVRVTITLMSDRLRRLNCNCDCGAGTCEHIGAALAFILEEKYPLGLSEIPKEGTPLELLSEEDLELRAVAERAQRAKNERFRLVSQNPQSPWTDYLVTSQLSGKTYRVALRGLERGDSYCSCPDFRVNTLGTCKHILYTLQRVKLRFSARRLAAECRQAGFAVHLQYEREIELRLLIPTDCPGTWKQRLANLLDKPISDVPALLDAIQMLERAGQSVVVYPDAEEWIQQRLHDRNIAGLVREIRANPAKHALRTELLKQPLLPYQLDGVAFAVGAGRAVLADDMGLGKTIQGIGVAELLARVANVQRVLIVCPTSLKAQWDSEIQRFCDRDCQLVMGSAEERFLQYDNGCFFTICNYEQVLRDLEPIEQLTWDLIILDEGQRIKNWAAKTSRVIKSLRSRFALVLSGTPLENRLDELYSVVQFIDDRRLGPGFRFFHRHRMVDEKGKVTGYKNLDELRANLKPLLLRRTRASVLQQLPPRTTETVRIPASEEQERLSRENVARAAQIASKKFLTEMDLLRIQQHLLVARMAADSTFLVDKQEPAFSTKLEYLADLFEQLWQEPDRKVVLFSEWTTMLDLIEKQLKRFEIEYVRLDGSVPQRKRQQLVHRFQKTASCRLFMTTNAGSTGLNLQSANTVINVDLPWNPAVLEQRISRAHRMGQKRPVNVYLLVTTDTFEERLLSTLADKRDLAMAALDPDSDVTKLNLRSSMDDLKRRLESLVGEPAVAPEDRTLKRKVQQEADDLAARQQQVAAAGSQVISAVCQLVSALIPSESAAPSDSVVREVRGGLESLVRHDERGRPQLQLTLPDTGSLDQLAGALARLIGIANAGK